MKNKLNTCKKGCKTCNDDAKDMQNQLQNKDPKELSFEEQNKYSFHSKRRLIQKNK